MFYHNTKYKFALAEGSPDNISGGIIACSAMSSGQLIRRVRKDIRKFAYLQHRLFDPQLYLSSLDPNTARATVVKLASHQWFAQHDVPDYDSKQHGTLRQWKEMHEDELVATWRGQPIGTTAGRVHAVRAAVQHQLELGCDAIILPAPLTTVVSRDYQDETDWIDIGIQQCREMRVSLPVYATIALSDMVLRGASATEHPLLHTITSQIAAREELSGAYLVIEQAGEDGYYCTSRDTLLALLVLVDDLTRGAAKQVAVNYMGTFGAVLTAAGASIWGSGYYLSQRRLKLVDFEDKMALALPRYHSLALAGDIGLQEDIQRVHDAGLGRRLFHPSEAAEPLYAALTAGTFPDSAPQWAHRTGNIGAASAHYNQVAYDLGARLYSLEPDRRIEKVERWLERAVATVERLKQAGIQKSSYTNLQHQAVWLDAFLRWRDFAGV